MKRFTVWALMQVPMLVLAVYGIAFAQQQPQTSPAVKPESHSETAKAPEMSKDDSIAILQVVAQKSDTEKEMAKLEVTWAAMQTRVNALEGQIQTLKQSALQHAGADPKKFTVDATATKIVPVAPPSPPEAKKP